MVRRSMYPVSGVNSQFQITSIMITSMYSYMYSSWKMRARSLFARQRGRRDFNLGTAMIGLDPMSRPCSMHSVLVIAAVGDLSTRRDGRAAARGNLAAGKLLTHNGNNSSSAASARCAAVFLPSHLPSWCDWVFCYLRTLL